MPQKNYSVLRFMIRPVGKTVINYERYHNRHNRNHITPHRQVRIVRVKHIDEAVKQLGKKGIDRRFGKNGNSNTFFEEFFVSFLYFKASILSLYF